MYHNNDSWIINEYSIEDLYDVYEGTEWCNII